MVNIQPRRRLLLNAISGTATSVSAGVDQAGRLSLMVSGMNMTSASATFYVQVTNRDEDGWVNYNRLITNVTNTNAQQDARVSLVNLTTSGTAIVFFPAGDTFNLIRVQADVAPGSAGATFNAALYVD